MIFKVNHISVDLGVMAMNVFRTFPRSHIIRCIFVSNQEYHFYLRSSTPKQGIELAYSNPSSDCHHPKNQLTARVPLTLSCHVSLLFIAVGKSSWWHRCSHRACEYKFFFKFWLASPSVFWTSVVQPHTYTKICGT